MGSAHSTGSLHNLVVTDYYHYNNYLSLLTDQEYILF